MVTLTVIDAQTDAADAALDLAGEVRAVLAAGGSQATVAAEWGVSPAALNQWLSGRYKGDNERLNNLAAQWLQARAVRAEVAAALPQAPSWYETPLAKRIWTRLTLAHYGPDIAVVDGAAGVGKTATAAHYAATQANVWHVTLAPDCTGVTPALEEIAFAMGLTAQGGGAAGLRRAIVRRLRQAGESGALLIIDEAQHLGTAAFDEIRTLHDLSGAGVAYLGNKGVWAQLVAGGRKGEALDRVHSRIGARVHCAGVANADIAAMLDAWGISDRGARSALGEIARRPGALRAATKAIRTAQLHAGAATLTAEHVRLARDERGV